MPCARELLLPALLSLTAIEASAALVPCELRCEGEASPLGLSEPRPRLSWQVATHRRGACEAARHVQVASSLEALRAGVADLWESGRLPYERAVGLRYEGRELAPGEVAWWRVRVWDAEGRASNWSQPARWEAGPRSAEDWGAQWIRSPKPLPTSDADFYEDQPAPLVRREFEVPGKVARARAYVSGLGCHELRLNGARVGDHELDPGWTSYAQRVFYATYDITDSVREGRNAVGAILGNGWYNPLPLRMWGWLNLREHLTIGPPRLIARIVVETEDGRRVVVTTGSDWRTADGPILRNSLYLGEVYDARRELPGWDEPGFDDAGWLPVVEATEPVGALESLPLPPVRVTETLAPVAVTEPSTGVRIYDFGVNLSGRARIEVEGMAGSSVRIRYGELLHEDGSLNPMTSSAGQVKEGRCSGGPGAPPTAWQEDRYALRGGEDVESWTPRFTFHGFRYAEVSGDAKIVRIAAERMHTDVEPAGEFACSDPMLEEIDAMVSRTLLSNLFSVQSDCPHREKFGYGGDIVASSAWAAQLFDMQRFYRKAVLDLADAVRPNGGFTETAPFVGIADASLGGGAGPVGWGTAHPLLVWQLYTECGDRELLVEQYEAVRRWVALLRSAAPEGILDNGIADHESLAGTPPAVTGTALLAQNLRLAAAMARALGHQTEAVEYEAAAREVAAAFTRHFLDVGSGRIGPGTQCCQATALFHDLLPDEERASVLAALDDDLHSDGAARLTTGIFGTRWMLMALTEEGRAETALELARSRQFPSWGYMLDHGATTLWEHWAWDDNTFSHNHPMFGSVSEWLYAGLAGLRVAPGAVGFDRILIRPSVVGDISYARAERRTVRGPAASEWSRDGGKLHLRALVPPCATAEVWIPTVDPGSVTEGGRALAEVQGIGATRIEPGYLICEVGAGDYRFESVLAE